MRTPLSMNQSLHWSLLAGTALALLLMTPISPRRGAAPTTTFATVAVATVQRSLEALAESANANRDEVPEAGTVSLLIAGAAGFWLVRRRSALPSR